MNFLHSLVRGVNHLSRFCGMLAAALIFLSILLVCHMVLLRYVFSASTTWQTDIVTFGLVGATMLGCPYLLHKGAHVNVDLLITNLSKQAQDRLKVVSNFAVMLFGLSLFVTGLELTHMAWSGGWVTETVAEIPLWIAYIAMPIGFGLLALQAISEICAIVFGFEDSIAPTSASH